MKSRLVFFVISLLLFSSSVLQAANIATLKSTKKISSEAVSFELLQGETRVLVLSKKELLLVDIPTDKIIAKHSFGMSERPLRVDLYDLDKDGLEEVFVTSFSAAALSSYVFKIGEGSFKTISSWVPFYFRVDKIGGDKVLLGQSFAKRQAFAGSVFELVWKNGKLKKFGKLDLPKNTGIYQFAVPIAKTYSKVWVRDKGGFLKLFEKKGKKWKAIYKSAERYRGNVNCHQFIFQDEIQEREERFACAESPPVLEKVSLKKASSEKEEIYEESEIVIVDDQKFKLAGVLFRPDMPKKTFLKLLNFSEYEGLIECKTWGPYQGWIADFKVKSADLGTKKKPEEGYEIVLLRNSSEMMVGKAIFSNISISKSTLGIDCKSEM